MTAHDFALCLSMHLECFHEAVSSCDEYIATQLNSKKCITCTAIFCMTNKKFRHGSMALKAEFSIHVLAVKK